MTTCLVLLRSLLKYVTWKLWAAYANILPFSYIEARSGNLEFVYKKLP